MTGTGEVTKRRVKEGRGEFPVDCPLEDCAVRVHYKATIAGTDQVDYNSELCGRFRIINATFQDAGSPTTWEF
jgi:hypothetical protein